MADYFSRYTIEHHEYGLVKEVFDEVVDTFFLPQFDLFASEFLHVTDNWASFCWTKGSQTGDAFLLKEWPNRSYIFPPGPLVNEVVARLAQQEDLEFILIAPAPSGATGSLWHPVIRSLITREPLILGKARLVCRLRTGRTPDLQGELAAYTRLKSSRGC